MITNAIVFCAGLVVAWFFFPAPAFMQRLYVKWGLSKGTTKVLDSD